MAEVFKVDENYKPQRYRKNPEHQTQEENCTNVELFTATFDKDTILTLIRGKNETKDKLTAADLLLDMQAKECEAASLRYRTTEHLNL